MAKADKKTAKKEKPVEKETAAAEFKYGVKDLAEELGIKETSVRVQLRNKGIEKAGKSYGWNSKAELKEVVAQLKTSSKDEDDEDEAPKKKSKKAKPAKAEKPAKAKKAKTKKARDEEDEDEDED
jgi:hypothetical protein